MLKKILLLFISLFLCFSCSIAPMSEEDFTEALFNKYHDDLVNKYGSMERISTDGTVTSISIPYGSSKTYYYKVDKTSQYTISLRNNNTSCSITYSCYSTYTSSSAVVYYYENSAQYETSSQTFSASNSLDVYANNNKDIFPIGFIKIYNTSSSNVTMTGKLSIIK
jgi:hypothetical protein